MAKPSPVVDLTSEQAATLQAWHDVKQRLNSVKTDEMTKRLDAIAQLPFAGKEEGSQTLKLAGGWSLKLTRTMDYAIERKNNNAVMAALNALYAVEPDKANLLIERWEPVMSVKVYKSLSEEGKKAIAEIVTIKPGAPQLELVEPAPPKEEK